MTEHFTFSIFRSDVRGEEQKIRTANDRALQEMRMRLERELEEAKLELLEVDYHICSNKCIVC